MNTNHSAIRNYPVIVTLQATYRCNLRCPMCFRQSMSDEERKHYNQTEMSREQLETIAHQVFPYAKWINLSIIGEPMLYSDFDTIITLLERYRCKLEIMSNMTPLQNHGLMERLFPHIGNLRASVDGATQETFETIRKGAKFEPVVSALRHFGQLRNHAVDKPAFGFHVTLQQENYRELPDIIRLAHEVGATYVSAEFLIAFDTEMQHKSILATPSHYQDVYEEACRVAQECKIHYTLPAPPAIQKGRSDNSHAASPAEPQSAVPCRFLWHQVVVDPNGITVPCCHPTPPQFPGNAFDDFWAVWASPQANQIRKTYLTDQAHPSCRSCYIIKRDTLIDEEQVNLYDQTALKSG